MTSMAAETDSEYILNILKDYPPFSSLTSADLTALIDSASQQHHKPGTVILDGFQHAGDRLWVVLDGQVGLWNTQPDSEENFEPGTTPDEVLVQGGVFGYTVVLHSSRSGPRAVALTDITLLRIPGDVARPMFASEGGIAYLAKEVALNARLNAGVTSFMPRVPNTAAEMIRRKPVVCANHLTVQEAAQIMNEAHSSYIIVTKNYDDPSYLAPSLPTIDTPVLAIDTTVEDPSCEPHKYNIGYGILTDEIIRSHVVAQGKSYLTPAIDCAHFPIEVIPGTVSSDDALAKMFDKNLLYLPVINSSGRILGVIHERDFHIAPSTSSFHLRRRIADANEIELIDLGMQIKDVAAHLFSEHASARRISSAISVLYDALVHRAISLALLNTDLTSGEFVWLSLGSIARREATLNSDLDSSIIIFPQQNSRPERTQEIRNQCIQLARGVHKVLSAAGLPQDSNGVTAINALFTRTVDDWYVQANKWVSDPFAQKAMIQVSLALDARPVWGIPDVLPVAEKFRHLHKYPHTLRYFLDEALAEKAKIRTFRDLMAWKGNNFDVKKFALLPIINLARWLSLWSGCAEISTVARLQYAQSVELLDADTTAILIRSFEELSRIRLENQFRLMEDNEPITNIVNLRELSPIDKTVLIQSVHQIALVQKKISNIANYTGLQAKIEEN